MGGVSLPVAMTERAKEPAVNPAGFRLGVERFQVCKA